MREPIIVDTSVWCSYDIQGDKKEVVGIRKSNDCLIARYGFKYNLKILYKDWNFDMIIKHYK